MSDYTINVTLNTENTPPVTASPNDQAVPFGTGHTVQWVLDNPNGSAITSIVWGSNGSPFVTDPSASNNWTGVDNNSNESHSPIDYSYTIFVKTSSGQVYGSDPEIANDPGTGPADVARTRRHHHLRHHLRHQSKHHRN